MRIGLASDSFGNVDVLGTAIEHFLRSGAERIFFLGGRIADLEEAIARRSGGSPDPRADTGIAGAVASALAPPDEADRLSRIVVRVASRSCPEYATGAAPRKQLDLVEGRICCLVHDKSELDRDDIANATVLFHGNSEDAGLVQIGPRCFVTPGRLRGPAPDGRPPTFAIADVGTSDLVLTVFSAKAEEIRRERASFAAQLKMSVR